MVVYFFYLRRVNWGYITGAVARAFAKNEHVTTKWFQIKIILLNMDAETARAQRQPEDFLLCPRRARP